MNYRRILLSLIVALLGIMIIRIVTTGVRTAREHSAAQVAQPAAVVEPFARVICHWIPPFETVGKVDILSLGFSPEYREHWSGDSPKFCESVRGSGIMCGAKLPKNTAVELRGHVVSEGQIIGLCSADNTIFGEIDCQMEGVKLPVTPTPPRNDDRGYRDPCVGRIQVP